MDILRSLRITKTLWTDFHKICVLGDTMYRSAKSRLAVVNVSLKMEFDTPSDFCSYETW